MQEAVPSLSVEVSPVSQSTVEPVALVMANVTVPVGVPALAGTPVTVAVMEAGRPDATGGVSVTFTLEPALDTSCT